MPTFFSKVFSRGKDKEKGKDGSLKERSLSPTPKQAKRTSRASAQSLLEGRFEAVSPSVSPTAEKYEEKIQTTPKKDREKEKAGLFRPKSRTTSGSDTPRKQEEIPQLKLDLNLSSIKDGSKKRDLSVVYEGDTVIDDAVIGEKRLNPAEALKLLRACSTVLTSRGLETLGVMHPHWHSASPAAQRRIISLLLSSLAASSDSSATPSTFDSELEYARSSHDVAAVFRWVLRHLQLEGNTFDKDNSVSLAWYDKFAEKEKAEEYPKDAYSNILVPAVKASHAELLGTTLNLVSRLASHSDWNGTSGSKLSMFFGHYLLTGNRVENIEDWPQFYNQWERAGRALEHIFLSSLRDEEAKTGIPKRLSELVVNYPYAKSVSDGQFPRPTRFATRAYDALYVLVTRESSPGKRSWIQVYQPLQIVENALKSEVAGNQEDKDLVAIWEDVKKSNTALNRDNAPENRIFDSSLSSLLSDESIRMLSLKSNSSEKNTPTISMFTPVPEHDSSFGSPTANGRAKVANGSTTVSRQTSDATASSPIASDWNVFTSAGFGESTAGESLAATLLDNDVEKTNPPPLAPRRSLKKSRSPGRASRADKAAAADQQPSSLADAPVRFKTSRVSLVKIDEAFVDFWSDALLDPISDTWPNFVVCQLKSDVVRTHGDRKIAWLVIEQKFVEPALPPTPQPARRASSPRPSVKSDESRPGIASRVSATFSPRKRFNLFGSQTPVPSTVSGVSKKESKSSSKGTKVNELGEVIPEEKPLPSSEKPNAEEAKAPKAKAEPSPEKPKDEVPKEDDKKADEVLAGAAAVAVGAGAVAIAADAAAEAPAPEAEKKDALTQVEEAKNPVKEDVPAVPPKDAESELQPEPAVAPPPPPVPEKEDEEPPAVPPAEDKPTIEAPHIEAAVPEPALTQAEVVHAESAQATEPTPSEPKAVRDELAETEEPTVSEPEATPAQAVEEVSRLAVEEPKEEEPTTIAEVHSGETEETIAEGAGESRFVEHIESSPDNEKPAAFEAAVEQIPAPAEGATKSDGKDHAAPGEPSSASVVGESSTPLEHTVEEHEEVPAAVGEPKEEAPPVQADVQALPVAEETLEESSAPEQESVPVKEDVDNLSPEEPTAVVEAPVDDVKEHPTPVVEETEAVVAPEENPAQVVEEESKTVPRSNNTAPASQAQELAEVSPDVDAVHATENVEQPHEQPAVDASAPAKDEVSETSPRAPTSVEVGAKSSDATS